MPIKTLRAATAATAVVCSLAATSATAETMIFAVDLPSGHFFNKNGNEPLMACITERTNGAIDFNYMPDGQLVKRNEMTDSLNKGIAQFAFSSLATESAQLPLQGVTLLPGVSNSATEGTKAYRAALEKGGVLLDEYTSKGVHPVLLNLLAPYQIMAKEKLDEVSKWQGKKIRSTGSALNVLVESLGASSVQMSTTEVFVAMQRGTIDGTILSFASVKPYSVDEVATHYSSNTSFGTSASIIGMDLKLYNSMTAEQQKAIDDCGREAEMQLATWVDENEGKIRDELAAAGKVIYELTPEQLAQFNEKLVPVEADFVGRLKERNLPGQEALDEFKAAVASVR